MTVEDTTCATKNTFILWNDVRGGIRERNAKPAALDVQQSVARRTGTKTSIFNALSKANTSGDKDIFTNEITAKLYRK